MDEITTLKDYLQHSPKNIQDFLMSPDFEKILQDAGVQFDLRPSKLIDLKNETLFVLVGLEDVSNFQKNLIENLELPKELTNKIAEYIEKNIFSKFSAELKEIENLYKEAELATTKGVDSESKSSTPTNLPTTNEGQKMPVFQKTTEKPKPEVLSQSFGVAGSKPSYIPPDHVEPLKSLSQEDIFANRPKPKPYVPPTRDFMLSAESHENSLSGMNAQGNGVVENSSFPSGGEQRSVPNREVLKNEIDLKGIPRNNFIYRDEKIGGVNIEKEVGEEIEENIDRNELLRDIENPVKSEATGGTTTKASYKGNDPYRESLE